MILNYFIYYGTQMLFKFIINEKDEDDSDTKYDSITNLI